MQEDRSPPIKFEGNTYGGARIPNAAADISGVEAMRIFAGHFLMFIYFVWDQFVNVKLNTDAWSYDTRELMQAPQMCHYLFAIVPVMSIQIYKCDHIGLFIIPARFSLRNNTRTIHDNGLFIMFSIKYKNVYLSPFSKTSYGYHGYHWAPLADYRPTLNPRGGEGKKRPPWRVFQIV